MKGGLLGIIARLNRHLMHTTRGLLLAAACCFCYATAWFLLAYDFTARSDHPAWFRFVAIVV